MRDAHALMFAAIEIGGNIQMMSDCSPVSERLISVGLSQTEAFTFA